MGKRERAYSTSSSSGGSEHESSSKRSRRDKGKSREKSSNRHRLSKDEEINPSDDFYTKSKEFRHWLLNRRKPKQFTKMDASDQKRYFKKFCRRWNKGKLDASYYEGSLLGEPTSSSIVPATSRESREPARALGPARPATMDDLAMQREAELDYRASQKDASRLLSKRDQRETRQEERDNRATGRDRVMEKRAEKREGAREMASAREQGDMEFGDDVLMGGSSSSFQDAIRRRDSSRQHQERQRKMAEKQAVLGEKLTEMQKKENDTMAMASPSDRRHNFGRSLTLLDFSSKPWPQPSTGRNSSDTARYKCCCTYLGKITTIWYHFL